MQDLQALVMAVDQEGRILGASDALAALLGYDGRELPGHFLTELVDRSDAEDTGKSVNRAFDTHEPVSFTTRFTIPGERTVNIEWHGSSAMSTGVTAATLTVLGHDVTTLHQRLSHLELLAKELHCVRKVNHLISRERDPQRLIEKCCEILVSSGCLATCYILLIKDGELSGCAGFGEPAMVDALNEMVERRKPPRCLSRMEEQLDVLSVEDMPELCENCPALASKTCALSVSLESEGQFHGRLKASFPPGTVLNGERIYLLREVAADIALALQSIELEKERNHGNEELRVARDRLAAIVNASPAAIVSTTTDGRVTSWNGAAEKIFGWKAEEVLGEYLPIVPPEKRQEYDRLRREVIKENAPRARELVRVRKDGSPVTIQVSNALLRGPGGSVEGIMSVVMDITERQRALESLEEERVRLRQILDSYPHGVYMVNSSFDIQYINPYLEHAFGPVGSRKCFEYFHDLTSQCPWCVNDRVMKGESVRWEWISPKNGRVYDLFDTPFMQSDGSLSKLEFFNDITERKEAEEALRASEKKLRGIYQHLPIPTFLWQHGEDGFVLMDFNDAARMVTKDGIAALQGRKATDLYGDQPDIMRDLERCLKDRSVFRREMPHRYLTTGEERTLIVTYGFVPPDIVIVHTEDVTEHRRTEEQLRFSQKMEAVGRLAGGIAHDFNNLLTVINCYSDMAAVVLQQDDPARADILEVLRAGEQAASLTRQLLAFSRKQVFEPKVFNINKTVEDIRKMLSRILGEDVKFEVRLAEKPGNIHADPSQVEQILMNLVVNARDAMPQGGVLTIETCTVHLDRDYADRHADIKEGRYVLLSVSDTGYGMDREMTSRIFEPFFTTKEQGKGTGLGLSTVYGIIKQSGGDIAVYSEPGYGTTFKVFLPCTDDPESESTVTPPAFRVSGNETVLIVEDDNTVRRLTEQILREAGYKVLSASGGTEALEIFRTHGSVIDLLLTDVVMPQMSGKDLARSLAPQHPNLRILYMSGYTDNAIVHHGVLDPGISFINKPFSGNDLVRRVGDLLTRQPDGKS